MTVLSALAALGGFAVRVWEVLLAKPKLVGHFDWITTQPPTLRFYFVNRGLREESIVEIRFGTRETPVGEGWTRQQAILDRLPLRLGRNDASPPFEIAAGSAVGFPEFENHLIAGRITRCFVTTGSRGKTLTFSVPRPP